jgi:hypothetical protein
MLRVLTKVVWALFEVPHSIGGFESPKFCSVLRRPLSSGMRTQQRSSRILWNGRNLPQWKAHGLWKWGQVFTLEKGRASGPSLLLYIASWKEHSHEGGLEWLQPLLTGTDIWTRMSTMFNTLMRRSEVPFGLHLSAATNFLHVYAESSFRLFSVILQLDAKMKCNFTLTSLLQLQWGYYFFHNLVSSANLIFPLEMGLQLRMQIFVV